MKYHSPPGLFDLFPWDENEVWKSSPIWQHVESVIRRVARSFCYGEVRTPILEKTELFTRSAGETSDIVSKEMYSFEDKGGRHLSLRPEGTAPVMRALIEGQQLAQTQVQKLFYIGPMFRYDRPQAGRYRQHHQFGAEAIGPGTPEQDAEVIQLACTVFRELGLENLTVTINSIGSPASRDSYRAAFQAFLRPHLSSLSGDSQRRFETNPLRILDSKDPRDNEICAGAPSIQDYLDEQEQRHFEQLLHLLDLLKIPYHVDASLVRGLDYYTHTVFEVMSESLGAQSSIGGGGRYDGLLKELGGPDLPAAGFGIGMERLIQTLIASNAPLPEKEGPELFFIPLDEKAREAAYCWLTDLRMANIPAQLDFSGRKLGKAMQYANKIGAKRVAVIGQNEIDSGRLNIKEMDSGEETCVNVKELKKWLKQAS